jgi:hypothetical protein
MKMIYRVVNANEIIFDNFITLNGTLPSGKTLTGFWSKNPTNTVNLYQDREEQAYLELGGGASDFVIGTNLDNAIIGDVQKDGNNDRYDSSEIGVIGFKDINKIKMINKIGNLIISVNDWNIEAFQMLTKKD